MAPAGAAAIDSHPRSLGMPAVTAAVLAILLLAGVSVVSAATSEHVEHPTATALYQGYMVAASLLVGLYWYLRRPGSAFGALLIAFGVSAWVVSWQSSDWPLAFDIGVLAEAVAFVLTFYVAAALDDPPARIGFWDPATQRYREPDGAELAAPEPASGRSRVEAHRGAQPVAAMVIDDALAEDPELVRAATSATVLAVEHGNLEGQLRASQLRVGEVGAAERKRIEDNLHDSAQQRLVALGIRLAMTSERLDGPEQLELQRFGAEVDRVLEEVRTAAAGVAPPELTRHGVAAALTSLTGSGVLPVTVQERGFGRRSEAVETTVFFCCAEALQNAAKHAGAHASASVILSHSDGWVHFSVEDDGAGFDPATAARGHGLRNINDRLAAAGGSLTLDTGQGRGTRVSGRLPADI